MAHENVANKIDNGTLTGLNCDHLLIKMDLNIKQYDPSNPPKWNWNWKSGDMQAFTQEVEDNVNCVTDANVDRM